MKQKFDPRRNYNETRKAIGYIPRRKATQKDYDRIGFMSGLEVHQQLRTKEKLFCHCPAGIFQKDNDYDAELIRHMRPTLSELGEYDGTALMEFKTRKEIVYRIKNETACTYDVDDTPPFPLNREALDISIEIALLSKLKIVGEVHITRKQYLDGSIPTGFQRTAIIGVEGEIPLKKKKVRLIQLSLEEDSCREVSDIGHQRIYRTDRLGMPLIETVTYPDCLNPGEVMEACNYIRFLNRSTGKVRTGIGAGREDVNVSCKGGTRIEIKGVAHTRWIPELTHNECFRQWSLLHIREILAKRVPGFKTWKMAAQEMKYSQFSFPSDAIQEAEKKGCRIYAVNLPDFHGILSHFTQPGKIFADDFSERLKVIACIDQPNMTHSEELDPTIADNDIEKVRDLLKAKENDAQVIFWGPEKDIATALETIEERCLMAFEKVPNETRKSFADGTTIFERVLPGADRMYPDTDSKPIPLEDEQINRLSQTLPTEVVDRYQQLKKWGVPEDTYHYIFTNNHYPVIERIAKELKVDPVLAGTFFGHRLKYIEGHYTCPVKFNYNLIFDMFKYLKENKIAFELARTMMPVLYEHPKMDFESILTSIGFKRIPHKEILSHIPFLKEKFASIRHSMERKDETDWIMGQLSTMSVGNIPLSELPQAIEK